MANRTVLGKFFIALITLWIILGEGRNVFADMTSTPPKKSERQVLGDLDLRSPEGERVSLIPFITRKAVVIVFWTTWCPICRAEVPRLNRLNENPRIKVIAVNEGDSVNKIKAFISANSVGYEVVVDPDGAVAAAFQVTGMPDCVIIDRSGRIVFRGNELPKDIEYYLER
jgi:thiol-disulfide isomerase/thioredoxin